MQQALSRGRAVRVQAIKDNTPLPAGKKLRVAVIGGGPSGACAAETLAKGGVETVLLERKMDNCKVRVGLFNTRFGVIVMLASTSTMRGGLRRAGRDHWGARLLVRAHGAAPRAAV
jgi:glycine/D-amino acid oxidase-like deaminating enzyme